VVVHDALRRISDGPAAARRFFLFQNLLGVSNRWGPCLSYSCRCFMRAWRDIQIISPLSRLVPPPRKIRPEAGLLRPHYRGARILSKINDYPRRETCARTPPVTVRMVNRMLCRHQPNSSQTSITAAVSSFRSYGLRRIDRFTFGSHAGIAACRRPFTTGSRRR